MIQGSRITPSHKVRESNILVETPRKIRGGGANCTATQGGDQQLSIICSKLDLNPLCELGLLLFSPSVPPEGAVTS